MEKKKTNRFEQYLCMVNGQTVTVDSLTEYQAKKLLCNTMDAIDKISTNLSKANSNIEHWVRTGK